MPETLIEKFTWMEDKWGFVRAPLRDDAFCQPLDPFSIAATPKAIEEFNSKLILGGVRGGLTYGYLWSKPNPQLPTEPTGTGYGKTALLLHTESRINHDFGDSIMGALQQRLRPPLAAAYVCLDNDDVRSLYALLFSAVERWADASKTQGPAAASLLAGARARVIARLGCDEDDASTIRADIERTRRNLPGGATLPPLREEVIEPFAEGDESELLDRLAGVSAISRSRNGLSYFETAVACLIAAGIEHVFFFLDQLEYMVTNAAVTKARKTQDIARFRTVFTQHAGLANRTHVIFTLHHRASEKLQSFWDENRLPSFDPDDRGNENSVVVLRGLEAPERIADLVLPYFDAVRPVDHPLRGQVTPLEPNTFALLWRESTARPGIIIRRIAKALHLAAEQNRATVDQSVIAQVLGIPIEDKALPSLDDVASSLLK